MQVYGTTLLSMERVIFERHSSLKADRVGAVQHDLRYVFCASRDYGFQSLIRTVTAITNLKRFIERRI